jgi:hypothetical protein
VIAVDTNVLVAALRADYPHHKAAVAVVRGLAEGSAAWALPWPCIHEFVGIVTNARVFRDPSTLDEALGAVEALLESPSVRVLADPHGGWPELRRILTTGAVTGARVHDAKIAWICLAHGVSELWTADRDFSRFPKLKCRNPLVTG